MNINLKSINEHSYSFSDGFNILAYKPSNSNGMRQLDWMTVKELLDSNEYDKVEVGLAEDYYQTHAVIFDNNKLIIRENDGAGFYGASRWATPAVKLTKDGETGLFECWIYGDNTGFPDWLLNAVERIYPLDDEEDYE
jgi:hypothetical protein